MLRFVDFTPDHTIMPGDVINKYSFHVQRNDVWRCGDEMCHVKHSKKMPYKLIQTLGNLLFECICSKVLLLQKLV